MAYQPIQAEGGFGGFNRGLRNLTETLTQARQQERLKEQEQARLLLDRERMGMQQAQYADQQKRLKREDYEQALLKAQELAAAGNMDAARSLLAPFVSNMQDVEKERPLPLRLDMGQPGQPPAQAQPPAMPDPQMGMQQPIDSEDPSRSLGPSPMPQQAPAPQASPMNPLIEARQKEIQADQVRARKLLAFQDPNGQRVTIDPMQGEIAQRERREAMQRQNLETFDEVVKATNDPTVARYAQELRPAIGMSAEPIRPQDVMTYIRSRADRAQDLEFREQDRADQRAHQTERDRFMAEQAMARARLRGAGGGGRGSRPMTPGEIADNERADAGQFGVTNERWEKGANVDKLTDQFGTFQGLAESVGHYKAKGDIINQRKALYEAARYITGPGILRQEEYDNTVKNTAGWSANLETKIAQKLTSDISPQEWAAMEKFVENANSSLKSRALRTVKNFDARVAGTRHVRTVPDEVAAARAALAGRFGLTEEDVGPPPWMQPQQGKGAAPAAPKAPDASVEALLDKVLNARAKGAAGGR